MTTAHSQQDIATIKSAFKESVAELQDAELPPRRAATKPDVDPSQPPVPNARLGRDRDGQPAWFVPDPAAQGKYVEVPGMMAAVMDTPEDDAAEFDPFAGGSIEQVVATTEAQREVWLGDRLGQEASLAYNEATALRLRGALDEQALAKALDRLVERHDALRATISPTAPSC